MSINLDETPEKVGIGGPGGEAYRQTLDNLQANILWPHGRNYARHVFLKFTGDAEAVRSWIRDVVAPTTLTASSQLEQILRRRKDENFDGGPVQGFLLSASGYRYLELEIGTFASDAFRKGMKSQNDNIIEDILDTNNKDARVAEWEPGFREEIHALITVADRQESVVDGAVEEIGARVAGIALIVGVEKGVVLRRTTSKDSSEPVEHFGYFDGISNPLFTKMDLDLEADENRRRLNWNAGARLSLVLTRDPFAKEDDAYGSYLVYRKLGQDVEAFDARVAALAQSLGVTPELAGAMVVGRFKDGTPVVRSDKASVGNEVENDFDFTPDDSASKCPFHSHIRKVNPRGTTPLTSLDSERKRRIVRRGIPYGRPVPGVAHNVPADPDPKAPRGLLFMCFQANVEDQFEFIQRTWVDNEHFPTGIPPLGLFRKDTGDDPVIGQDSDETQWWPKVWGDAGGKRKAFNFESAVSLKGGEYFFAPSIPFLKSV